MNKKRFMKKSKHYWKFIVDHYRCSDRLVDCVPPGTVLELFVVVHKPLDKECCSLYDSLKKFLDQTCGVVEL